MTHVWKLLRLRPGYPADLLEFRSEERVMAALKALGLNLTSAKLGEIHSVLATNGETVHWWQDAPPAWEIRVHTTIPGVIRLAEVFHDGELKCTWQDWPRGVSLEEIVSWANGAVEDPVHFTSLNLRLM